MYKRIVLVLASTICLSPLRAQTKGNPGNKLTKGPADDLASITIEGELIKKTATDQRGGPGLSFTVENFSETITFESVSTQSPFEFNTTISLDVDNLDEGTVLHEQLPALFSATKVTIGSTVHYDLELESDKTDFSQGKYDGSASLDFSINSSSQGISLLNSVTESLGEFEQLKERVTPWSWSLEGKDADITTFQVVFKGDNNPTSTPVPEPSTYGAVGLGALSILIQARRLKRSSQK